MELEKVVQSARALLPAGNSLKLHMAKAEEVLDGTGITKDIYINFQSVEVDIEELAGEEIGVDLAGAYFFKNVKFRYEDWEVSASLFYRYWFDTSDRALLTELGMIRTVEEVSKRTVIAC